MRLHVAVDGHCCAVLESVVIDGLTQERDLDDARVGEFAAFVDDVIRRAVDFGPAREGNDAVGAELVAASRDSDVRGTLDGAVLIKGRDAA